MVTNRATPEFRFEYESIGGSGELIAIVGDKGVAARLRGAHTRLLHVILKAWDQDPAVPEGVRGLRTYAKIAKAYANHVGYCTPIRVETVQKYMDRIQKEFDLAWRKSFPRRKPPRVFERLLQRGARVAIEIPRENRRRRDFDALVNE